jgi:hypothetical protein
MCGRHVMRRIRVRAWDCTRPLHPTRAGALARQRLAPAHFCNTQYTSRAMAGPSRGFIS